MFLGEWEFQGRVKRPPTDPVNALLSFGYTLIANEIHSLSDGIGFDPYIGFYHELRYGAAALAFDLMEPFRHALVDRLTLRLINTGIMKRDYFQDSGEQGVRLTPEGMKVYFREYEAWLNGSEFTGPGESKSFRTLFRDSLYAAERWLLKGESFKPFIMS